MGRDRVEKISTATYIDVWDTMRSYEIAFDSRMELTLEVDATSKAVWVKATDSFYIYGKGRREVTVTGKADIHSVPLASVIYQVVTRMFHQVDHLLGGQRSQG